MITLSAEDYVALLSATEAARHQVALWESDVAEAYALGSLRGFEPKTPIVIMRDCLAKCADEAHSSGYGRAHVYSGYGLQGQHPS